MPSRRLILALPLLGMGASCGFKLRGAANLHFNSIALTGFAPRSPLAEELRTVLERSVVVEPAPAKAEVVLLSLTDARTRKAVAFTASGQVRDMQLRTVFRYRVHTPSDRELIAESEISLYRDLTFIEVKALGKEQEEQALYREMQSDIVLQVMLRLSAIQLS
jgi:LPS-assembly lipoprotein